MEVELIIILIILVGLRIGLMNRSRSQQELGGYSIRKVWSKYLTSSNGDKDVGVPLGSEA